MNFLFYIQCFYYVQTNDNVQLTATPFIDADF